MSGQQRKDSEASKSHVAPAPVTAMDAHPDAVLAAYGHTMLVWQILEQHLGQLWVTSLIGEYQSATDRTFRRGVRRSIHAVTKATAAELLRGLKDHLESDLHGEIEAAIRWRDVLVHRYLRERMRGSLLAGHFQSGTSDELGGLYDRFVWLASELEALIVAEEEELADQIAEVDDELVETLEAVGRALLRNEPLPRQNEQPRCTPELAALTLCPRTRQSEP
jgi:hypothetical protein